MPVPARHASLRATPISCSATGEDDASAKRKNANRLALLAEQAALEAEALEMEAKAMEMDRRGQMPEAEAVEEAPVPIANTPSPDETEAMALRAPLRWLGPYAALALSLPDLSSPSQKQRQLMGEGDAKGVTLDFVLDTAANTNTISQQVAGPTGQGGLELTQVGSVPGGVGAGGTIGGGATYMLGTCELADVPKAERVAFISGLTATALPVAAPTAAGLLGVPFLNSFAGGVDFCWGPAPAQPSGGAPQALGQAASAPPPSAADAPSITFYGDAAGTDALRATRLRVPVETLPGSGLPTVTLLIGGVKVRALLDTGSPITVLNAAAAKAAGVQYDEGLARSYGKEEQGGGNPFARVAAGLKTAQAAAKGEVLTVGGADGPVSLARAQQAVKLELDDDMGESKFEGCLPYVGELPGLAALDGLGASAGPAAILGVDVLRKCERMWFTTTAIYLE